MMTPEQVLIISAIGALFAITGLVLLALLGASTYLTIRRLHRACTRLHPADDSSGEDSSGEDEPTPHQDDDLAICQAIDALPATDHPKEEPR